MKKKKPAIPSDALVFFGATGDLAYKQIFPALQAMVRHGHLDMPVVGVAKGGIDLDHLKARAEDSLKNHGGVDPAAFTKLCSLLRYVEGDYADPNTFATLRKTLGNARNPIHYLAIPPSLFATVAEALDQSGCAKGARVVIEKPFGHDRPSAKALNRILHSVFKESAIYRIDHYLGKEPVQNLLYFRHANPLVEAGWSRHHIESVQITMAENFGVSDRGRFYDEAGAIRDVVQNHMLQLIACIGMEAAASGAHEHLRDARTKLLKAVRPLDSAHVARGQFRGYLDVKGVAPGSTVETFAVLRFEIKNKRWDGVPFFVRVGKCLPVTATEIVIRFKQRRHPVLDDTAAPPADYYRFQLGPKVVIALGANVKKPGELLTGETTELVAQHQAPDEMAPYERLLTDAAHGDPTLFAREDAVEQSWRIVDPILANPVPLQEYEPNTWGPPKLSPALIPEGGWHNPSPA